MKNWNWMVLVASCCMSCNGNDSQEITAKRAEDKLIDELTSQVRKNPDSANLRMNLINALDSLRMYKEAVSQTDSLIERDSLNNQLWLTRAQLLTENKDTSEAIKSYIKAANIYPSADEQLNLANLLAETKNPDALLICDNVKKMAQGRETEAAADFIAGIYHARTANFNKALQLFDKAINEDYTLMEAYMEKGFIYFDTKKYGEALKVFEKATTVNNMYADAWYWKAKCYEAMGNKNEAIENYQRSLAFDKQLKEAAEAIERLK